MDELRTVSDEQGAQGEAARGPRAGGAGDRGAVPEGPVLRREHRDRGDGRPLVGGDLRLRRRRALRRRARRARAGRRRSSRSSRTRCGSRGTPTPIPIRGGRFSSNWHLSAARAQSVVRLLIANGLDAAAPPGGRVRRRALARAERHAGGARAEPPHRDQDPEEGRGERVASRSRGPQRRSAPRCAVTVADAAVAGSRLSRAPEDPP